MGQLAGLIGCENPAWKGGVVFSGKGYCYIYAPDHPRAVHGYAKRATLVLEDKIGRYLSADELAHHIDGNKANDDPDNLALMGCSEHARHHHPRVRERVLHPDSPSNRRYAWPSDVELLVLRGTMSLRQIALKIGCNHKTVDRRIRRLLDRQRVGC